MGTLVENVLARIVAPIVGAVVDRVFPSGETRETRENQSYEWTPTEEISWEVMQGVFQAVALMQAQTLPENQVQA